jgi:tetratricopeptide (TPR) repeat protein
MRSGAQTESSSRSLAWIKASLIALACWYAFAPSFHGSWLWDDFELRENPMFRDPSGWWKTWLSTDSPDYFPLRTTVVWLQSRLWHENLLDYHVANSCLHAVCALLVWRLLWRLRLRFAWVGGLVFAVHPVAVESVAWISEMKNTLSLLLLLLSALAWVRHDENPERNSPAVRQQDGWYFASLFLFLAAMLSKASVAMFPFLLLLFAFSRRGRVSRTDFLSSLPFFAISAFLGIVTVWFQQHRAIADWSLPHETPLSRLVKAGFAVAFYAWKFVFPATLMPIYPRWSFGLHSPLAAAPWIALCGAAVFLATRRAAWGRRALLGLGWFAINLVPILGFVPMAYLHVAPVADHFAYLSLVGFAGLAAAGLEAGGRVLDGRSRGSWTRIPALAAPWVCALAAVAALAVKSHRYSSVFVDQKTMWTYNLALNPKSPAVYVNLAFAEHHDGDLDQSVADYRKAIELDPTDTQAEAELAGVLIEKDDLAGAMTHYRRALAIEPTLLGIRRGYAKGLAKEGRTTEAIAEYERILAANPRDPEIETCLGKALEARRGPAAGIPHYRTALLIDPRYADAENSLGMALEAEGRPKDALAHLEAAVKLNPGFAEAQNNLGFALAGLGRLADAVPHLQEAVRLKPGFGKARNNLGFALAALGRTEEAIAQFQEAIKTDPGDASAHFNLAHVFEAMGRLDEAAGHYQEALKLRPGFTQALEGLLRVHAAQALPGGKS